MKAFRDWVFFLTVTSVIALCGVISHHRSFIGPPADPSAKWKAYPENIAVWDLGPLTKVTMEVHNTVHYQLNNTAYNNAEWDALTPYNGLVYLGDDLTPYMPSFFHQLQCLNIIRLEYSSNDQKNQSRAVQGSPAQHCLNYLRQMLLCRLDLNLESVVAMDSELHAVAQRRTQSCDDWRVVYSEQAKNYHHFMEQSS
ncbi:hypothetical protein GYMLUDRAFT_233250 [Collybiopsis luxurians FD-317 M1]|uniref:Uncharacterized protein n=1 Tax=Collybiopsis luxurians FD-317 M1 TaxID=944289 RepID=A0A0D0AR00_9AGAR|nr:hypothetical protein GYMLUDRAFT_233250 [Collybiopsis luxurians FD-317 M1]